MAKLHYRSSNNYNWRYGFIQDDTEIIPIAPPNNAAINMFNQVTASGFSFNQMGVRPGIKQYGVCAIDAIKIECQQLDRNGVYEPVHKCL